MKGKELIIDINNCEVKQGSATFWWLGQLGYAIKLGRSVIYIDPYLSEHKSRNIASLLKPEEVTNADFIIGSHDHTDHIDRAVWKQLSVSSPRAKFIVPNILIDDLSQSLEISRDRFIGLNDGVTITHQEIKITGVASSHEFLDLNIEKGEYPYLGYVIEGNDCVIYHSGDTCMYEGLLSKLRKWNKLHIMFLPINGRDGRRFKEGCIGNMTYQEAVDLAGNIKPSLVVPGHYEMFDSNSENPALFTEYIEAKYEGVKYWVGKHGERVEVAFR